MHALGIDWEDWHQLIWRRVEGYAGPPTDEVLAQTESVLSTLNDYKTRATFFIVGMVAEQHKEAVRRVVAEGHELALHGYAHLIAKNLTRAEFINDTARGKDVVEQILGRSVRGYRAPELSIDAQSYWVLDALAELGFVYDSSIVPTRNSRFGTAGFRPDPARYQLANGREILEFPLTTAVLGRALVPAGGGSYFRLLPRSVIRRTVTRLEEKQQPYVTYFHPYEFVKQPIRYGRSLAGKPLKTRLAAWRYTTQYNFATRRLQRQFAALLTNHRFTAFEELINGHQFPSGGTLL